MNDRLFFDARTLALGLLRSGLRRLRRGWETLTIYLPVLLMGLMALLTYWMVQRTPSLLEKPQQRKPQAHEVDFYMRGALIKTFDYEGYLQNELSGVEIRHYGDNRTLEVDQPRLFALARDGRAIRASAQRALTQDDGSLVELMGQAQVSSLAHRRADGKELPAQQLRGDHLLVDTRQQLVRSLAPVVLTSGENRFSGDLLSYDHKSRVTELTGRVKVTIVPR